MAAEPAKIPLTIKKAIRDFDPIAVTQCAELSALTGMTVKYDVNWDTIWAGLVKDSAKQNDMVKCWTDNTKFLNKFMANSCKDALVKATLLSVWTTGVITFSLEVDGFDKSKIPANTVCTWNNNNGLRITANGGLDMFTHIGRFHYNPAEIESEMKILLLLQYVPLAVQPDGLPLSLRILIRDESARREAAVAAVAKAVGLDKVTWDYIADYQDFVKSAPEHVEKASKGVVDYVERLAACLERECKDDMVKEAIVDAFDKKTIRVRCMKDHKTATGLKSVDTFGGIQIDGGVITVMSCNERWWQNIDQIKAHQLVKLF